MKREIVLFIFMLTILVIVGACEERTVKSSSGVSKATVTVTTDLNGNTQEQIQILEKIKRDNQIGKIRHLYIISAYTGYVLEYYTIKGKVTSGNKRLSPKTVRTINNSGSFKITADIYTDEMLSDDGTYGDSSNYFYFFDTKGEYHQVFPTGGTYTRVSDVPLTINKTNLTFK